MDIEAIRFVYVEPHTYFVPHYVHQTPTPYTMQPAMADCPTSLTINKPETKRPSCDELAKAAGWYSVYDNKCGTTS